MPRQTKVEKSRREWNCAAGHVIPIGSAFVWLKWRNRGRYNRCLKHLPFQTHELQSPRIGKMAGLDDTISGINFDNPSDAAEGLRELASEAEGIGQEYADGVGNMPDSLQSSPTAEAMEQIASEIDDWVGELNSRADEIDSWAPDESAMADLEETAEAEDEDFDEEVARLSLWEDSEERGNAEAELSNKPEYQG